MEAVLLVYCGMRVGEAAAALWSWFDWTGRVVHVKQGEGFSPKRHQERTIPLRTEDFHLHTPLAQLSGRVSRRGTAHAALASRAFAAYLPSINVTADDRGAHCVRHSWVSYRLALGVPSLVVQREAGHSTILTTQKYAHSIPAGWLDGWPKDGSGEFYLRRETPKAPGNAKRKGGK